MSGPRSNPYEKEALEALFISVIKEPARKLEFEKHADEWVLAYTFYREESDALVARGGLGLSKDSIESQLRGIDFNHPVTLGQIPPPTNLVQFQAPTTEGKLPATVIGNYWAMPGQTPPELGLSDFSKLRNPIRPWEAQPDAPNVKRTPYQFEPLAGAMPVRALLSVAAPVADNWSRRTSWAPDGKVVPVITPGGGKQIFSPAAKSIFTLKAGQEQQKTPEQKYEDNFSNKYGRKT